MGLPTVGRSRRIFSAAETIGLPTVAAPAYAEHETCHEPQRETANAFAALALKPDIWGRREVSRLPRTRSSRLAGQLQTCIDDGLTL
jgi:hypothetical protein